MLGYIIAIIALLVVIPLVFLMMRGSPKPGRTAVNTKEDTGALRSEPVEEQTAADEQGSVSRPSPPES